MNRQEGSRAVMSVALSSGCLQSPDRGGCADRDGARAANRAHLQRPLDGAPRVQVAARRPLGASHLGNGRR